MAFNEYARIFTFPVDQETYENYGAVDVAPKYPDHIGFVPRPDGSGSRPHRGDFSYDFTRINSFDRTSTAGAYTRPHFCST